MMQMPSREKLLAWIDQVSFAVVEMNLYLDTHPEDEDALAFFRDGICGIIGTLLLPFHRMVYRVPGIRFHFLMQRKDHRSVQTAASERTPLQVSYDLHAAFSAGNSLVPSSVPYCLKRRGGSAYCSHRSSRDSYGMNPYHVPLSFSVLYRV